MTGISDTNATFFEVSGRGMVSRERAAALRDPHPRHVQRPAALYGLLGLAGGIVR